MGSRVFSVRLGRRGAINWLIRRQGKVQFRLTPVSGVGKYQSAAMTPTSYSHTDDDDVCIG